MKSKRMIKYILTYLIILLSITFVFAFSLNKAIHNHFENGLLDNLEVTYKNNYDVEYKYKGTEMDSFESYSDAMRENKYGILLYSNNGLTYNRKTPLGNQSYIIDYSWLNKGIYDKEDIITYTKEHKLLMLMRTVYLSSGWLFILLLSLLLLFIMKIIVPTILYFLVNIVTFFKYKSIPDKEKSDEQFKHFEIFRSLILTKSLNNFKDSREYVITTFIYSYFMVYLLLINDNILYIQNFMLTIILIYIGLLTILSLYSVVKVLFDTEYKKLDKENDK